MLIDKESLVWIFAARSARVAGTRGDVRRLERPAA